VPFIGTGRDEVLRIYYGNAAADEPNESMTWNSSYVAVYHMNNKPGDATKILDSTSNANHGTKGAGAAAPTEVAGVIGKAQQFVAADNEVIFLPVALRAMGGTDRTLTALVTFDSPTLVGTVETLWYSGSGGTGVGRPGINWVRSAAANLRARFSDGSATYITNNLTQNPVGAHLLTLTIDVGATMRQFFDGAPGGATDISSQPADADDQLAPDVGGTGGAGVTLSGLYDELRLSSVAWGPEWIALEHKTLLTPTVLYGISAEGTV
jgi:hypothetical protein